MKNLFFYLGVIYNQDKATHSIIDNKIIFIV